MTCASDPRLTPANGRVAAAFLKGQVEAATYASGAARQLTVPVSDLLHAPGGRRVRQLLMGERVTVYETLDGWCFVMAARDGYVGYLRDTDLGEGPMPTHRVSARATHVYSAPDFKASETASLSMASQVQILTTEGRFAQTPLGYIPTAHLALIDDLDSDPVAVAERLLGTPYLWGGNSAFGIDCSGLVQVGCLACGIPCPGDSDLQEAELGHDLPDDALKRGDLLFWKGHVAWVADPDTLIHANAFHMAVTYEHIQTAITRIAEQGDGPVTRRKRLGGPS